MRSFTPEQLKEALRRMCLIRRFEEGAEEAYMRGLTHGTMHLSIGPGSKCRWLHNGAAQN
jgi:pyruvate dehydrogenase E1 component alpha subunit